MSLKKVSFSFHFNWNSPPYSKIVRVGLLLNYLEHLIGKSCRLKMYCTKDLTPIEELKKTRDKLNF
jgi:hypothetical protein